MKHEFAGCWSRRIDDEHRLVYEVKGDKIRILACRYHYLIPPLPREAGEVDSPDAC